MTTPIAEELAGKGVSLLLGQSAEAFESSPDGLVVRLKSGQRLPAQLVVLGVGVRPENRLAVGAGLEVGPRGGIIQIYPPAPSPAGDEPHIIAIGQVGEAPGRTEQGFPTGIGVPEVHAVRDLPEAHEPAL